MSSLGICDLLTLIPMQHCNNLCRGLWDAWYDTVQLGQRNEGYKYFTIASIYPDTGIVLRSPSSSLPETYSGTTACNAEALLFPNYLLIPRDTWREKSSTIFFQ